MKHLKNFKTILGVALVCGLIFSGCKKSSSDSSSSSTTTTTTTTTTTVCYPTSVKENGKQKMLATWDSNNKITELKMYDSTGTKIDNRSVFTYTSGKISQLDNYDNSNKKVAYNTFEYNSDGTYKKITQYNPDSSGKYVSYGYQLFDYASGKISKVTNYATLGTTSSIVGYTTYEYDSKGNVSKETIYDGYPTPSLYQTMEFQYDSKSNPVVTLGLILIGPLNPNNVTQETIKDKTGTVTSTTVTTYEYSSNNYPTKMTDVVTYKNGTKKTTVSTVDYTCK